MGSVLRYGQGSATRADSISEMRLCSSQQAAALCSPHDLYSRGAAFQIQAPQAASEEHTLRNISISVATGTW